MFNPVTSSARHRMGARWTLSLAALLALVLAATIALAVLMVGDSAPRIGPSITNVHAPAVRSDGGPEESAVAAAAGSQPSAVPAESSTAAAIGAGLRASTSRRERLTPPVVLRGARP